MTYLRTCAGASVALSLLITPLACGGDDSATDTGGSGLGGSGLGGGSGNGGQAGDATVGGAAGSAGATSEPEHDRTTCDYDDLIGHYDAHGGATCSPGETCVLDTECTSGEDRLFSFTCIEDLDLLEGTSRWVIDVTSCESDSESCISKQDLVGETLCLDGSWSQRDTDFEQHAPQPCPRSAPSAGDTCEQLDIGAVDNACGYPCADDGWQTLRCTPYSEDDPRYSDTEGRWVSETECSNK